MNQKIKITRLALELNGLVADDKRVKQTLPIWWQNPRLKAKGGLRLTEQGFTCLAMADIKYHRIKFEKPITEITNKFTIWIDHNIDCPFYMTHKEICVFGEHLAVQLVLFAGDIQKFYLAKERFKEKEKIT